VLVVPPVAVLPPVLVVPPVATLPPKLVVPPEPIAPPEPLVPPPPPLVKQAPPNNMTSATIEEMWFSSFIDASRCFIVPAMRRSGPII
jgi:hypothetical protein